MTTKAKSSKDWLDRRPEYNALLLNAVKEFGMNNRDIIHSCDMFGNHPHELIEFGYEQCKKEAFVLMQKALGNCYCGKYAKCPVVEKIKRLSK